jgi:hypothetical protein
MLRRCFQESNPNPCFGMIMPPTTAGSRSSGNDFGTMLEIKSVKMLHDGRSIVETRGTHAFRIMERGTMDGYMVARIERCSFSPLFSGGARASNYFFFGRTKKNKPYRILDYHSIYPDVFGDADSIPSPLPPIITAEFDIQTTPGAASGALTSLTENEPTLPRSYAEEMQQLTDACRAFLAQIQRGAAPWVVQRLNYIYGPMPTDPTHFSYWMALVSIFFSFLSMFGHARMQARHVRPCAIADRDIPPGPADRRYGKGQTFTSELAAASSSVSSALDRAIEQSLVRRRACHGRRTRMKINPDAFAFALGGSRMAALFHDNAGDPVFPTDGCQGLENTKTVSPVRHVVCWCAHRHRWLAHTAPRLSDIFVRVACISFLHPFSLVRFSANTR